MTLVNNGIVRRVGGLFALADPIEAPLRTARRQVDALTPSLLARASKDNCDVRRCRTPAGGPGSPRSRTAPVKAHLALPATQVCGSSAQFGFASGASRL